jgi:hypothetical protein
MKNTIRLGFSTDSGKRAYISVPHADTSLSDGQVKTAMEGIVTTSIVSMSAGNLVAPETATLIALEAITFNVE